jgi:mannosyltransferase OCH1-like enzyme
MIPKIVHQIYWNFKNVKHEIPIEWQKLYLDCKTMYEKNGWKHILWNKNKE